LSLVPTADFASGFRDLMRFHRATILVESASEDAAPDQEVPAAWTRRNAKTYPRLPRVPLPPQSDSEAAGKRLTLDGALAKRRSCRRFTAKPLPLEILSEVL